MAKEMRGTSSEGSVMSLSRTIDVLAINVAPSTPKPVNLLHPPVHYSHLTTTPLSRIFINPSRGDFPWLRHYTREYRSSENRQPVCSQKVSFRELID